MKRILCLLLTLVLLVGMMPVPALASEDITEGEEETLLVEPAEEPAEEPTEEPAEEPTEVPTEEPIEELPVEILEPVEAVAETVNADDSTCGENLTWSVSGGTLTISGTGAMADYTLSNKAPWYEYRDEIAKVVVEEGVTSIGDYAFYWCTALTNVTIPGSVTSIGNYAFYYCTSLTNVTISEGVTTIGNYAFFNCTSLTDVTIPGSVTTIGSSAFWGCTSLTDVTISEGVTSIGSSAFWGCTSLTEVTISEGVSSIGAYVFENCTSLTSLTLPRSLTSIGSNVIKGCTALESIIFNGSSREWTKIAPSDFSVPVTCKMPNTVITGECGENLTWVLDDFLTISGTGAMADYTYSKNAPWYEYRKEIAAVVIEDGVTTIGSHAFSDLIKAKSATIPDSVTKIGNYAFSRCNSLTNVTIPGSVTTIGEDAFQNCKALTAVTISEGVTSIGSFAFWGCTSLTDVTISEGVSSIGSYVFDNCTVLTNVAIPGSVTSIGQGAFSNCTTLTDVTISEGVSSIGSYVFENCTSLTSLTLPRSLTSIGSNVIKGCTALESITFNGSPREWKKLTNGSDIGFPVTCLLKNAVLTGDCGEGVQWKLEEGVLTISGTGAMADYTLSNNAPWYEYRDEITKVVVEEGVTSIGNYAFYCYTSLTSLTLPRSLTSIGTGIVASCSKLESITFNGTEGEWAAIDPGDITIPVKCKYRAAGTCGDRLEWILDNEGTLTISGTGAMADYTSSSGDTAPWFDYRDKITKVVLNDGVTSIGQYAFYNCTSLTAVTIPGSVTSIASCAFVGCTSLTNVTIPDGVTTINSSVFQNCTSLETVTIPGSVTAIENAAFQGCATLTALALPKSLTSIGSYVVSGCTSLTNITYAGSPREWKKIAPSDFPTVTCLERNERVEGTCGSVLTWVLDEGTLTISGTGAMADYTSSNKAPWYEYRDEIAKVVVEDGVTSIGEDAFWYCEALTNVTIPGSITTIGENAFYRCTALTDVTISEGVTSIDNYAFDNCTSLTSLTLPRSLTSIGTGIVAECPNLKSITFNGAESEWDRIKKSDITAEVSFKLLAAGFGNKVYWTLDHDGLMTFTGSGDIMSGSSRPWNQYVSQIKRLEIAEGVTSIGSSTFCDCTNLTEISIPDTVTYIGWGAFENCTALTEVTIPSGVSVIDGGAFKGCSSLRSINIPEGVTEIGENAFNGCASLRSVTIPEGNKEIIICPNAFAGCTALESITIPSRVTRIEDAAFAGCTALKRVTIPGGISRIFTDTFKGCSSLEEVVLPDTLAIIDSGAFEDCSTLKSIVIPASVSRIENRAFANCTGLKEIWFTGDAPGFAGDYVPEDEKDIFLNVTAKVYYPVDNATWTAEIKQNYGGSLTWNGKLLALKGLSIDQEYVVLDVGGEVKLNAVVEAELPERVKLKWETDDSKLLSVDEDTGLVTARASGVANVIVTATLDDTKMTARCRVNVNGQNVMNIVGVQLSTTSLTTELYRTDYAAFDVILHLEEDLRQPQTVNAAPGEQAIRNAITAARFENADAAKWFDLVVKDDRTIMVVPHEDAATDTTLSGKIKSSYTSKIVVTVGGEDYTTTASLKLTVKKTLPKLKASTLSFNTFYTSQSKTIKISGATVTQIQRNTAKDTEKTSAIPAWLTLSEDSLTQNGAPSSGSANVYLTVKAEGWAKSFNVTVPVKLSKTAPKLKLSATSVTLLEYDSPDDSGYLVGDGELVLKSATKGVMLDSLNVSYIEAPENWEIHLGKDGWFSIRPERGKTAITGKSGKITLNVHFSDTDSVVPLSLTIKTKKGSVMLGVRQPTSYKLNPNIEDGFFLSQLYTTGFLDMDQYKLVIDVLDKYGNSVKDEEIFVGFRLDNAGDIVYTPLGLPCIYVYTKPGCTKPSETYRLKMDLVDRDTNAVRTEKSLEITITTLSKTAKASVSFKVLDVIDPTFESRSYTRLKPTFKNFFISRILGVEYSITYGKEDVTDQFRVSFDEDIWSWIVVPKGDVSNGTYTLKLGAQMDPSNRFDVSCWCTTKFTVKRTDVKLKLSKTSLSLNKTVGDSAAVKVTCLTKGYDFQEPMVKLLPSSTTDGGEIDLSRPTQGSPLDFGWSDGVLTIDTNADTRYGATYKVQLRVSEKDTPVTLTVTIPSLQKSTVTAKPTVKGSIDTVRDGSSIVITPAFSNCATPAKTAPKLIIESAPNAKNAVYEKVEDGLFNVQWNENGTSCTVTKAAGAELDTSLKYRAAVEFNSGTGAARITTKPISISVKSGTVKASVTGTPVLYKADRFSRSTFRITAKDTTLNPISRVEFKTASNGDLYELYDYGDGCYAIGFKNNTVQEGKKYPTSVSLNVFYEGNITTTPNVTVTLKLSIR